MVDFSYRNVTTSMVILKCIGPDSFFLERAIFPQEVFSSMAPKCAQLGIAGRDIYGPTLEQRLRVFASKVVDTVAD